MDPISLGIKLSELALWAIILWHVPPLIMGQPLSKVCQILVALIAIFASIGYVVGSPTTRNPYIAPNPSTLSNPSSIIK